MFRLNRCSIAALTFLMAGATLCGQAVNATLQGTVTDAGGGVVTAAKVIIAETNTNVSHQVQTNGSGNYILPDLPPGMYSVTVEHPGFKKEEKTGVTLDINTNNARRSAASPGRHQSGDWKYRAHLRSCRRTAPTQAVRWTRNWWPRCRWA